MSSLCCTKQKQKTKNKDEFGFDLDDDTNPFPKRDSLGCNIASDRLAQEIAQELAKYNIDFAVETTPEPNDYIVSCNESTYYESQKLQRNNQNNNNNDIYQKTPFNTPFIGPKLNLYKQPLMITSHSSHSINSNSNSNCNHYNHKLEIFENVTDHHLESNNNLNNKQKKHNKNSNNNSDSFDYNSSKHSVISPKQITHNKSNNDSQNFEDCDLFIPENIRNNNPMIKNNNDSSNHSSDYKNEENMIENNNNYTATIYQPIKGNMNTLRKEQRSQTIPSDMEAVAISMKLKNNQTMIANQNNNNNNENNDKNNKKSRRAMKEEKRRKSMQDVEDRVQAKRKSVAALRLQWVQKLDRKISVLFFFAFFFISLFFFLMIAKFI